MAAASARPEDKQKAEIVLDALKAHQAPAGNFPDPEGGQNYSYGFRQMEAGMAFCMYELFMK